MVGAAFRKFVFGKLLFSSATHMFVALMFLSRGKLATYDLLRQQMAGMIRAKRR